MADSWWVPVVSAGAALSGVGLTAHLQRAREHEGRLLDIEQEAYVDLYAWAMDAGQTLTDLIPLISKAITGQSDAPVAPKVPLLPSELLARTYIYLERSVAETAADCEARLRAFRDRVDSEVELTADERIDPVAEIGKLLGMLVFDIEMTVRGRHTSRLKRFRDWLRRRPDGDTGTLLSRKPPRRHDAWPVRNATTDPLSKRNDRA